MKIENYSKLYLMLLQRGPTFVLTMTHEHITRRMAFYIILFFAGLTQTLTAQQTLTVWPGDVNNNGVVNAVDVLWWSVAQDVKGEKRGREDSIWAAQLVIAWPDTFPNGLNYAYADCDGNGVVNEADLRIISKNFLRTRVNNRPDVFALGVPGRDPKLQLRTNQAFAKKGQTLPVEVGLGTSDILAKDFFGISFTIPYDPRVTGRVSNGANFELAADSWLGKRNAEVKEFVVNSSNSGKTYVAVYKKKKENVPSGEGVIGTFNIVVVEDIVSGIETVDLGLEDIKLVNLGLEDSPVSIDTLRVPIEGLSTARNVMIENDRHVRVFPNPVYDQATVEWTGEGGRIEQIEVFNLLGQRAPAAVSGGDRMRFVDLSRAPSGLYVLRIRTSEGVVSRTVRK